MPSKASCPISNTGSGATTPTTKATPPNWIARCGPTPTSRTTSAGSRIRGLCRFPFTDFAANTAWLQVVCWAADLVRWFQLLCLTGPLARALLKRLR